MLKLLIVEDEKLEREGLVEIFAWNALTIEVVGTAVDGIEGVELAEKLKPDIIITDIKMPGLNGLKMSKQIKSFLPNVKIIILSGYDDFQFAKEAIGFKANTYILKPVVEEELLEAVTTVVAECHKEKKIESKLNKSIINEKRDFLVQLFEGKVLEKDIEVKLMEYAIKVSLNEKVVVLGIKFIKETLDELDKVISELSSKFKEAICINYKDEQNNKIILCLKTNTGFNVVGNIRDYFQENILNEGVEAIVGIGTEVENIFCLKDSVAVVEKELEFGEFWCQSKIILNEDLELLEKDYSESIRSFIKKGNSLSKQLMLSVSSSDETKIFDIIDELFEYIGNNKNVDKNYIGNFLYNIIYEASLFVYNLNKNNEELLSKSSDLGNQFLQLSSISLMKNYMIDFFNNVIVQINHKRNNKDEYVIKNVINLIEERYMTGISLKTIASEVFLSPNYLGNLFKNFMGKTFNDYLSEYRMEKAKEILTNSNKKISTVAVEVGIPNTSYFCMIFKNTYGMAPKEYQDIMIRN